MKNNMMSDYSYYMTSDMISDTKSDMKLNKTFDIMSDIISNKIDIEIRHDSNSSNMHQKLHDI